MFGVLAMVLSGCKKEAPPTADFTYGGNTSTPSSISFSSSVTNATSYLWNFGDGSTSTDPNPSHTYRSTGAYTVTLTVTGLGGKATMIKTVSITAITSQPTADFTYTVSTANPLSVLFLSQALNATSYLWDFGDNSTSTETHPSHVYTSGGVYTVKLTATGPLGTATSSKTVTTSAPKPIVNFTYYGANTPAPSSVSFFGFVLNATSYLWDFGDGSTSTDLNPSHVYTRGGVYIVRLTATGPGGTETTTNSINIGVAFTKCKITSITVNNIPFTKPGGTSGWDLDGTGPDIYFKILDQNNNILVDATSSNRIADITPAKLPIAWQINTPLAITDLTSSRFIALYDYDLGTTDENMSYVGFQLSNYTTGSNAYPATVSRTQNGLTITLNLTWY